LPPFKSQVTFAVAFGSGTRTTFKNTSHII
jgi:hypothetical protein